MMPQITSMDLGRHNGEAAFLGNILDHPDDGGPRGVFADWLDERGDPRGEFIRVQLELASTPKSDSGRRARMARKTALLREHGEDWLGGLVPPDDACFRRGFLETVVMTQQAWVMRAASVLSAHPVQTIRFNPAYRLAEAVIERDGDEWFYRLAGEQYERSWSFPDRHCLAHAAGHLTQLVYEFMTAPQLTNPAPGHLASGVMVTAGSIHYPTMMTGSGMAFSNQTNQPSLSAVSYGTMVITQMGPRR